MQPTAPTASSTVRSLPTKSKDDASEKQQDSDDDEIDQRQLVPVDPDVPPVPPLTDEAPKQLTANRSRSRLIARSLRLQQCPIQKHQQQDHLLSDKKDLLLKGNNPALSSCAAPSGPCRVLL